MVIYLAALQCFVDEPCWCNNGGECHSDGLGVSCVCLPGFQGRYCDDIAEDNTSPYHTPETRDLPPYTTSRTGDSSQQRTPESRDASTYNPPEDPSPQNTPTHGKGEGTCRSGFCIRLQWKSYITQLFSPGVLTKLSRNSAICLFPDRIRKVLGCACAGNSGNVFPATDFQGNR